MTIEQFLAKLDDPKEFINRVSLLFFAADLADGLAVELEAMMNPHAGLEGNIKFHVKKIKQSAAILIKHSDKTLFSEERQANFATDAEYFKSLAYGWAGLGQYSKPFKLGALLEALDQKTGGNRLRVLTYADIEAVVSEIGK